MYNFINIHYGFHRNVLPNIRTNMVCHQLMLDAIHAPKHNYSYPTTMYTKQNTIATTQLSTIAATQLTLVHLQDVILTLACVLDIIMAGDKPILLSFSSIFLSGNSFSSLLCSIFRSKL